MKSTIPLVLALLFSSMPVQADTISIATGEYAPYAGESLHGNGFALHVVTEAFKRAGHEVSYTFLPWKRAYELTKLGTYQGTAPWAYRADREQDFYHSEPIFTSKILLFHLASNPIRDWSELSDLSGYKFGATLGYSYTEEFWSLKESGVLDVHAAATDEQSIRMLLAGRLDIFPLTDTVSERLLGKFSDHQRKQLSTLPKPLSELRDSLIFPKSLPGSADLREVFDHGLQQIKADGSYEKMHSDLLNGEYDG